MCIFIRNNCLVWWGYELINPLEHVVIGIITMRSNGFIKLITSHKQLFLIFTFLPTCIIFFRFPSPGLEVNILKTPKETKKKKL
jgi:hypothetical protein